MVEIRVKKVDEQMYLEEQIEVLKERFPQYSFYITLDSKVEFGNTEIFEIKKIKNHLNQKIKTILCLTETEEKKLKNGNYMTKFLFEIPNAKKTLEGLLFSEKSNYFKTNKFYLVEGKIELGNPDYIKKNVKRLGKDKSYVLKISDISEIDYEQKEEKYEISRAELHSHTMFSKNDGLSTPADYLKAFNSNKCHAIALTDHNAVFGFIPFVNELKGKTDKKLILGSEIYGVSQEEYKEATLKRIEKLNELINNSEKIYLEEEIIKNEELLKTLRTERDGFSKLMKRKTISDEERMNATENYTNKIEEIKETTETIKEIKNLIKTKEEEVILYIKEKEKLEKDLNTTNNIDRDHLVVLIKTPDEEINYRDEKLKINLGVVELYKMITKSYTDYFSSPTDADKKMYGKRPVVPYEYLFNPDIRKHFILSSACVFGKHMKLIVNNKENEFREWIKKLDCVELHPSWNNSFMVEHIDFPNINKIEDVYALNRRIYQICKEENVPCVIVSDAHITSKDDRELRSSLKNGYINLIINSFAKEDEKRVSTDEDFSIENQPYIMSYEDMVEDFTKQGFTPAEIEEMHQNSNMIADKCVNGLEITLLPKKLFLPDFPNLNSKEELPKIVWEFAINKWSTDGTKEGIDKKIKDRIEYELELTAEAGYETLYMLANYSCEQSRELGYIVGSRGSVGSMLISLCAKISDVSPLEPHYYCEHCHKVEWVETNVTGLDLPDKQCECGHIMKGDGVSIEPHNFVGWIERDENGKILKTKIPDIDLNFSENVQSSIQQSIIDLFGKDNAIKSGTQQIYQEDALKNDIFRNITNIEQKVKDEEFDIEYMARHITTMRTTGSHPGGILVKPSDIPFEYVTPLVYVSDDARKAELSSFTEYHAINFGRHFIVI